MRLTPDAWRLTPAPARPPNTTARQQAGRRYTQQAARIRSSSTGSRFSAPFRAAQARRQADFEKASRRERSATWNHRRDALGAASASAIARPSFQRESRSFASARSIVSASDAGAFGTSDRSGACASAMCFAASASNVGASNGSSPAQHVVAEHAQRVDVAAAVDVELARGLLGRHVVRRAERARRVGAHRIERTQQRDAEIREHRATAAALEQNVLGLEIAMDDAVAVRRVERQREVAKDALHFVRRRASARAACARRATRRARTS